MVKLAMNPLARGGVPPAARPLIEPSALAEALRFHQSIEGYAPTPLRSLPALAAAWGLDALVVKDESPRFGLNAFKVLGASYAMGKALAARLGVGLDELPFATLKARAAAGAFGGLTFAATTDGNHGRGVAWTARALGFPARIFMPKGTAAARLENIRRLGQQAEVTEANYDETVRWVAGRAAAEDWLVIQDTAWPGYVEVPTWIMQGYATVAHETFAQWTGEAPTHVVLQAGVGAFAAVMAALVRDHWGDGVQIVVVEADRAACFYQSFQAGRSVAVTGDLDTIMAGLACGEPNPLAWDLLSALARATVAAADPLAAYGMRVLAHPLAGDPALVSGESGAIGPGLVGYLRTRPEGAEIASALGLGPDSRVLCFSTEGDTDPVMYRRIVWEGAYPLG